MQGILVLPSFVLLPWQDSPHGNRIDSYGGNQAFWSWFLRACRTFSTTSRVITSMMNVGVVSLYSLV